MTERIRYNCPVTGKREVAAVTTSERVTTAHGFAVTATVACPCGNEHSFTIVQVREGE